MSVRGILLRQLGNLVEQMSDAELARLLIAAGAISLLDEASLVRLTHSPDFSDPAQRYFWDSHQDDD